MIIHFTEKFEMGNKSFLISWKVGEIGCTGKKGCSLISRKISNSCMIRKGHIFSRKLGRISLDLVSICIYPQNPTVFDAQKISIFIKLRFGILEKACSYLIHCILIITCKPISVDVFPPIFFNLFKLQFDFVKNIRFKPSKTGLDDWKHPSAIFRNNHFVGLFVKFAPKFGLLQIHTNILSFHVQCR